MRSIAALANIKSCFLNLSGLRRSSPFIIISSRLRRIPPFLTVPGFSGLVLVTSVISDWRLFLLNIPLKLSFLNELLDSIFKLNAAICVVTEAFVKSAEFGFIYPGSVKKGGIRRSRDEMMIKGEDLLRPERLRKQDLILVRAAIDLIRGTFTSRHDQEKLLTP